MIRCGIINDRQRYGYKKNVCCLTNEQINQPTNNRCDCVFNIELIFVPCRIIISGHLCMHFFLHEIRDNLLENFVAEFFNQNRKYSWKNEIQILSIISLFFLLFKVDQMQDSPEKFLFRVITKKIDVFDIQWF